MRRIKTIREAFQEASYFLEACGVSDPIFEAEWMIRHLLQWDRAQFFLRLSEPWPVELNDHLDDFLRRRKENEPIQYMIGYQAFYGRDFMVNPSVLIPRPETELLVERVLKEAERQWPKDSHLNVVDVGTGSGVIAITLALERPDWQITAVDISTHALKVAQENANRFQVGSKIRWVNGSYLDALSPEEPIDILVSNPPYIPSSKIHQLERQVRDYEPVLALDGGVDGLEPYRILCHSYAKWKNHPRLIAFEVGHDQGDAVCSMVQSILDAKEVQLFSDLAGFDRVVTGWIK